MPYTKSLVINYASGGDSIQAGTQKIVTELDAVYTAINLATKLHAGAARPTVGVGDENLLHLDTETPLLEYWNGSSWITLVNPTGFDTGLTLAQSISGLSRRMNVYRSSATNVVIYGSGSGGEDTAAMVEIDGKLLRNTSNTNMTTGHTFSGASAGWYIIYAERDGSTSNFLLKRSASGSYVDAATKRIVADCYYSGTDFVILRNYEVALAQVAQTPRSYFHAYTAHDTVQIGTSLTTLVQGTEVSDLEGVFSSGVFTANMAGLHELNATVRAAGGVMLSAALLYNATTQIDFDSRDEGSGNSTTVRLQALVNLAVGDTVRVVASRATAGNNVTATMFHNAFWGRWIGKFAV